ncbi:MAG: DUF72 domain-containing protein [Candidatus Aminicenantes bacterium]|nr:DUF72 domain-containing protein [Candidatus Aminicenantes bacterium]
MARYYAGPAGWSYADWEGVVYPPDKPRGFHALPYLARFVDIIEVNSTFYRQPAAGIVQSWVKKIESFPDFLLAVKLHQMFTHVREDFGDKETEEFKKGIEPLRASSRLAALLLQFPWSFIQTPAHVRHLERLFRLFAGYPLAVEVRHASWDNEEFYGRLRERRVCFCNIDQPLFPNSLGPGATVTHPEFSYVRFHGRNRRDWFRKDAGRDDRYNYLYGREELEDWVGRIQTLAGQSGKVFIITNNHYRGQAMANALQVKNMLTGRKMDIPLPLLDQYPVLRNIVDRIKAGQRDLFGEKPSPDAKD